MTTMTAGTTTMTNARKRGGIRFPITRIVTALGAVAAFVALWGAVALQGTPGQPDATLPVAIPSAPAVQNGPANAVAAAPTTAPVQRVAPARRSRSS